MAAASATFGEVLERWLETKGASVEATTLASYRWIATTYVRPQLGATPLDKIRVLDLDTFYARLRTSGGTEGGLLSPRTVRYCHTVVSQVLDQARPWGMVARNVATDARVPRARRSEVKPLTVGALALRWTDGDSGNVDLYLARSIAIVDGRAMHRARLAASEAGYAPDSFVFSPGERRDRPWRPDNMTSRFIKLCKSNGVTGVRLHHLRHFVATNLGAAGTPIATISARLGHRDTATRLNV